MNTRQPVLNQTTFRILYYRYKAYVVPFITVLICMALFIWVIIPQVQGYFDQQSQIQTEQAQIATLKSNIALLSSSNSTTLNQQTRVVSDALPQQKDFVGILNAVSNASIISGIILGDYSFPVGNLDEVNTVNQTTGIQVVLNITGSLPNTRKFIAALKSQLPLADVTEVRIGESAATITALFYYLPSPKLTLNVGDPLPSLSKKDLNLLTNLTQMDKNQSQ